MSAIDFAGQMFLMMAQSMAGESSLRGLIGTSRLVIHKSYACYRRAFHFDAPTIGSLLGHEKTQPSFDDRRLGEHATPANVAPDGRVGSELAAIALQMWARFQSPV